MNGNEVGHRLGQLNRRHRLYLVASMTIPNTSSGTSKLTSLGRIGSDAIVRLSWAKLGQAMFCIVYVCTIQDSKVKSLATNIYNCDFSSPSILTFLKLCNFNQIYVFHLKIFPPLLKDFLKLTVNPRCLKNSGNMANLPLS